MVVEVRNLTAFASSGKVLDVGTLVHCCSG